VSETVVTRIRNRRTGTRCMFGAVMSIMAFSFSATPAAAWRVVLVDSVTVPAGPVRLHQVVTVPVPAAAADLVVMPGGQPGQRRLLERRLVLRRLVQADLARGATLGGAETCSIQFQGGRIDAGSIAERVAALLAPITPPAEAGAPASWVDIEVPNIAFATDGEWRAGLVQNRQLLAGRNLVPIELKSSGRVQRLTATVTLHAYGEIAEARANIARDIELGPDQFVWHWCDLADDGAGRVVGRGALVGRSASGKIAAGEPLRRGDLKETPLIRAGEVVQLAMRRGVVAVRVNATARQSGRLGQIITVRNELSDQLITARVVGAGLVEWSR
jgi:flagella basal body P-ring formation protein FlgA